MADSPITQATPPTQQGPNLPASEAKEHFVSISADVIDRQGFTRSGRVQFIKTVRDYATQLGKKAISYGDGDKALGMQREVTHDHVRAAAHTMARKFGRTPRTKWMIACQVSEYLFTAIMGIGAGNLASQWGMLTFSGGISAAVILIVLRLAKSAED